jgi:hypothetical protein
MDTRNYERESDAPANWENNVILQRNAAGEVVEVEVPDDAEEVTGDVEND